MLSLKILGWLGLVSCVLCEQKLLVDQLKWDFLELENELWNFTSNGLLYKSQEEQELYLVKKFHDFDQKMKKMPEDILRGLDPVRTIPNFLFLYSELKVIENKYEKFREYQATHLNNSKNNIMMEDMIYDIMNVKTGVNKSINAVYDLAFFKPGSMVVEIYKMIYSNFWCKNYQQSPQQMFYNLYNVIILSELKVYAMQQFAHLGNRLWDKGENAELSTSLRKNYEKKTETIISNLRKAMEVPKNIWRCDPTNYVQGKTYEAFTRLLQGHIQNEVDMSNKRSCRSTCSDYSFETSYGCYDYKSEFCRKVEKCNGRIINCRFIEAHASICLSKEPSRRYDYVRYNSGKTLGKSHWCSNQKTVNSWTRWFVRCHYCMCLCDDHNRSDRYVNLRQVMADVKNNRIVTGMRLVKENRILHIQIQEGKLLPYGYVDESTVRWVPLDSYKITDAGVEGGKDFFTLTYEHRSMALDEIQVNEDNYVMTGCGFKVIDNRVYFEIHVSPFDWHNGTVDLNGGFHIYETNPRTKISLDRADVPIYTDKPSQKRESTTHAYVEFTHTDFDKDAAQTTIPYIDTQEVINKPAVPLVGAGIYYKGNPGYGGFIAPAIKTYGYEKHLSSSLPKGADRINEYIVVDVN